MGQTIPLKKVTEHAFANNKICTLWKGKLKKCEPRCFLQDSSGGIVDRVSCCSPKSEFRFDKAKIQNRSEPMKVICEAEKDYEQGVSSSFTNITWYFYVENFPGRNFLSF